ncbi:hypothetical protein V6N00_11650 [Tersicoccus sp. MR15.9]|uniref:hypothetical protein n=1 Tax=Tersicoccus mangrovi TaxID=3121635 RepID=UPI002FE6440C
MAKLMTIDELVAIASGAGITLVRAPRESANLYVWVDQQGHDLYVGTAASVKRYRDEERFAGLDHEQDIVSGFVALVAENEAEQEPLSNDPAAFKPSVLRDHVIAESWSGPAIDGVVERLARGEAPTVGEVEQILIRIHIRTGRLIGNAQFASQWEAPIGSFADTVAALATDAARVSGVLPRRTTDNASRLRSLRRRS